MPEDFDTDPSVDKGESTPVVHPPSDSIALYRFGESPRHGPPTDLDLSDTARASQRVLDARVGEEVTQHNLQLDEPPTEMNLSPPETATKPDVLETTETDPVFDRMAIKIAKPRSRSKVTVDHHATIKKLRPFLLYSLPGLALGMAVSIWALTDRPDPNPDGTSQGVVAVAKPVAKADPSEAEQAAPAESVAARDPVTKKASRSARRKRARADRDVTQRAKDDPKRRQLITQAKADVTSRDYETAQMRLRQLVPLVDEPVRTRLRRCLDTQDMELKLLGSRSGRVASCLSELSKSP